MKSIERRLMKIESSANTKTNWEAWDQTHDSMTPEEAERIVQDCLNKPIEPLYVKTKEGFIDVHKIESVALKARICDDYAQMRINLYSKAELAAMGIRV